jgi:predicted PurR-regulated permease PerM
LEKKLDQNQPEDDNTIKYNSGRVLKVIQLTLSAQQFFLAGIFFILFFYTLYLTREIILPFVIALLFYFLLAPTISFLEKIYIPAKIGAALVIILITLIIGYGFYSLAQPAITWINKGPQTINVVDQKLAKLTILFDEPLKAMTQINDEISMLSQTTHVNNQRTVNIKKESYLMGTVFNTGWQFLSGLGVTILLLYFLLINEDFFLRKLVNWVSSIKHKKEAVTITREVENQVWSYLFARTIINIGLGFTVSILMYILGMPDPILWGVMAGVLEFIPYFGAMVSIIVIALVALFSFSSLGYAFLVTSLFSLIVFIEGNIISPIVIRRYVTLNPFIIFISLIFWSWIWGIAGAFIAIPLMVTIKVIFETLYEVSFMGELLSD